MLDERGWQVGGEGSGHILCLDRQSTGDGIVSALQVLHALRVAKTTLGDFTRDMTLYPQVLINVPVRRGFDCSGSPQVQASLAEAERDLDGAGRVLLRASGTEPLIRVMVEGKSGKKVRQWAETIAETVRRAAD